MNGPLKLVFNDVKVHLENLHVIKRGFTLSWEKDRSVWNATTHWSYSYSYLYVHNYKRLTGCQTVLNLYLSEQKIVPKLWKFLKTFVEKNLETFFEKIVKKSLCKKLR